MNKSKVTAPKKNKPKKKELKPVHPEDFKLRKLITELENSKIQLELQNKELLESRYVISSSNERYLDLYDYAPVGFLTLDRFGSIREINFAAAELLGGKPHQLVHYSFANKIYEKDRQIFRSHLANFRDGEKRTSPEIHLLGKNKELFIVQFLSVCIRERVTGELLVRTALNNLTEHKKVEQERLGQIKRELINQEELRQAKADAELANESKSAFLANMSHEIRTPLAAILGYTDLIIKSSIASEREEYAKIVSRNGVALSGLINDILDLSKVESGKLELERIDFDIRKLIEDSTGLFVEATRKKQIDLTIEVDPIIPKFINSDPTRIRQILVNLIGNAVKFTSRGQIALKVEPIIGRGDISNIKFIVKDTGIGMNEVQAAKLFQPFSQADNSMTRNFGGSGLGLALSRRLARALGGDVNIIKCAPNRGCTFLAVVNATPSIHDHAQFSDVAENTMPIDELKNSKILLVEDSLDNQALVTLMLRKVGMSVDTANNGQEGLAMAEANYYDVVLMDMQMPVLDGFAATRQLRMNGYDRPIIALTAHAMLEDRTRTLSSGCDAHLTKPLDRQLLLQTIGRMKVSRGH